jgi:hypothetical protein
MEEDREVDAQQLMGEVGKALDDPSSLIEEFGAMERPPVFNLDFIHPPHVWSLRINLGLVSKNWEIDSEVPFSSKRKYLGGLVIMVKHVVRSLTAWYMNPVIHEIRKFNMLVTRTLYDINKNLEEVKERLEKLEEAQVRLEGTGEEQETGQEPEKT